MGSHLPCVGVCVRVWKGKKTGNQQFHPYEEGYKRCKTCEIFIKTTTVFCPCCNERLRWIPKEKRFRDIINRGKRRY